MDQEKYKDSSVEVVFVFLLVFVFVFVFLLVFVFVYTSMYLHLKSTRTVLKVVVGKFVGKQIDSETFTAAFACSRCVFAFVFCISMYLYILASQIGICGYIDVFVFV